MNLTKKISLKNIVVYLEMIRKERRSYKRLTFRA